MEYQSTEFKRKGVIDMLSDLIDGCLLIYQRSREVTAKSRQPGKECESDCILSFMQATLPASTLTLTKNGHAKPVSLYKISLR